MQRVALTEKISILGFLTRCVSFLFSKLSLREIPFDRNYFGGKSFVCRPLLGGSGKLCLLSFGQGTLSAPFSILPRDRGGVRVYDGDR